MSILKLRRVGCQLIDRDRRFELCLEALDVEPGSRVAIVGPSGCGKTTLLELFALLRQHTHADKFFVSTTSNKIVDINSQWQEGRMDALRLIRAKYCGYIPSGGGLFPALSIRENTRLRAHIAGIREAAANKAIERLSDVLVLSNDDLDAPLTLLSRGQQIRGAILHGLVHKPRLVIADEPTSALHPSLAMSVMRMLVKEVLSADGAIVVSTHDVKLVEDLGFTMVRGIADTNCSTNRTLFR